MYKLVIISDIHHDLLRLKRILPIINASDYLIFCGDGVSDLMLLRSVISVPIVCVRGNNDLDPSVPEISSMVLGNTRVLVTHGHKFDVRRSITPLLKVAKQMQCNLVFFGHTHMFFDRIIDGVHFINPGALHGRAYGTYAAVAGDGEMFFSKEGFV
ncbi:MAG: YfcE family phosphodiesterase [Roseburia sp.]|nr:YfcE family phosphodiesterase [Roseburia sp.]